MLVAWLQRRVAICTGAELLVGANVYVTWSDRFDQLRTLLGRLPRGLPPLAYRSPEFQ